MDTTYYFLCKKKKAKRYYWYAHFPDVRTGKVMAKSVESLRKQMGDNDRRPITRKQEATIITQMALDKGLIKRDVLDPLFYEYVEKFWDYDASDYIRRRNVKNPNSIGRDYARNMQGTFILNAKPHLPSKLKLNQVQTNHIETVINKLIDEGKLSNATIQKVVQSMSVPLRQAFRVSMIPSNPMDKVESISSRSKERGILTQSELVGLFTKMKDGQLDDSGEVIDKPVYLACLLSTYTGMRQGEIRGLRSDAIEIINDQYGIITIREAFAQRAGFKTPKGKRDRKVPAPRWLCDELLQCVSINPYGNDLVFWSKTSDTNPISASYIRDRLYEVMWEQLEEQQSCVGRMVKDGDKTDSEGHPVMIRYGEILRRDRDINFHSFRHFFVTQMRGSGQLSEGELRSIVGHRKSSTTDLYDHNTQEQMSKAVNVVCKVIPFPTPRKVVGE